MWCSQRNRSMERANRAGGGTTSDFQLFLQSHLVSVLAAPLQPAPASVGFSVFRAPFSNRGHDATKHSSGVFFFGADRQLVAWPPLRRVHFVTLCCPGRVQGWLAGKVVDRAF